MVIKWRNSALSSLERAKQYISKDSPQNADKVIGDVFKQVAELLKNPEIHNHVSFGILASISQRYHQRPRIEKPPNSL